jgi:hypothetical protein
MNIEAAKKFSQKDKDSPVIFEGDRCEVSILKKFEQYGCLRIGESVKTLGVFDMDVDGIQTGMFLVSHIEMFPSEITVDNSGERPRVKLIFKKGDTFMKTTKVVVDANTAFIVWMEYIKFANTLKAISYEQQAFIFDKMMSTSGIGFPVDHATYEAIFAHLTRCPEDFSLPYRNGKMTGDFTRIPLNDVAHAATSTTSRIVGAYFNEGVNAALVNENEANSTIEDVLRK